MHTLYRNPMDNSLVIVHEMLKESYNWKINENYYTYVKTFVLINNQRERKAFIKLHAIKAIKRGM